MELLKLIKTNLKDSKIYYIFTITTYSFILGSSTYSTILFIFGAILLFNALVGTASLIDFLVSILVI